MKIAIITGASSGIGKEFASQLSNRNDFDEIWLIARRLELLQALSSELNSKIQRQLFRPVAIDICGKEGVLKFKQFLLTENEIHKNSANINSENIKNGIEIKLLINNAGFGTYGPFEETSVDRQMEMIDLNCTSLTGICGEALPFLNDGSVIINTSSLAAFMPLGNFAVYAASKSYVLSFSIALAAELKERGIKVCALCPGSVSTEFANVASNGARKEVKGGIPAENVVRKCLKDAYKGKKTSLYRKKWQFTAFFSRLVGRYLVARYTYKYHKRPHNSDKNDK